MSPSCIEPNAMSVTWAIEVMSASRCRRACLLPAAALSSRAAHVTEHPPRGGWVGREEIVDRDVMNRVEHTEEQEQHYRHRDERQARERRTDPARDGSAFRLAWARLTCFFSHGTSSWTRPRRS